MKTQRNTTELPISVAIERLRDVDNEAEKYRKKLQDAIAEKVAKRRKELAEKILLRVPEEFRSHVADKAAIAVSKSRPEPDDSGDKLPAWANEAPPAVSRRIEVNR